MKKNIAILGFGLLFLMLAGAGCVSFSSQKDTAGPAGMFVSTNRGDSWTTVSSLVTAEGLKNLAGVSVYRLEPDPQDPGALYWASRSQGLFFSFDSGKTWQRPAGALAAGFVYSVAIHPKDKCTIYATNGQQVFKSDDCNRSWEEVYRESRSDVRAISLAFANFAPYQIYLAETNGDLLQSYDGGLSWNVLNRFKTRLTEVDTSPVQAGLIYVMSKDKGPFRSADAGQSWAALAENLKGFSGALNYRRHLLHPTDADTLYLATTYGILVTHDRGDSWQALNLITPPGSVDIYGLAINPQNDKEIYYTATINERSTFYRTLDGGKNWVTKKLPSGQIPTALWVHPVNSNLLYVGFAVPPKPQSTASQFFVN